MQRQITIRIEEDLFGRVEAEAKEQRRSIAKQIEDIIAKYYEIKDKTNN